MTGKDNISEELRQISGFLAAVSRITPYGLPDGYFEHLPGHVLDLIRDGQSVPGSASTSPEQTNFPGSGSLTDSDSNLLNLSGSANAGIFPESASAAPVYSVPEGYFEGFAGKLMSRIKAGQQTDASPDKPLAAEADDLQSSGMPDFAPLSRPIPGFGPREELESLSPFLSQIDKRMPFTIPQGYFEELSATVASHLASGMITANLAEQEVLSPLLTELRHKQVYQAPEGYFEGLSAEVLEKVKPAASAPAKVISLGVRTRRNWLKYSAAAAVTGLILTGGWLWTHTAVRTGAGAASAEITKSLPAVSDQDIENYLDTNNVTNNIPMAEDLANSTASLDITDNDIKSFLGDVPDGELKQYMDEHGDVKNIGTN